MSHSVVRGARRGKKAAPLRRIVHGEALAVIATLPDACARMIYVDPPFNTGTVQKRARLTVRRDDRAARVGFGGRRYAVERATDGPSYEDAREGYVPWLLERLLAGMRCLTDDGSIFVHLDPRESHHVKVALDAALGRRSFVNEIVWAYDYGARTKTRWPAKHDVILWYAKDPARYVFDYGAIDRIPYMAPELVGPEDRRVVEHDRADERAGEDGLPDAEAALDPRAPRAGAQRARRRGARLLRGQRHRRRGGGEARSGLRAGGRVAPGDRGDGGAARALPARGHPSRFLTADPRSGIHPGRRREMGKQDLLDRVRELVAEVTRARFEGSAHAKLMRAHGYADGYMRALLDAGLADRESLIAVVGDARRDVVEAETSTRDRSGVGRAA
jgi:hypothetical protein